MKQYIIKNMQEDQTREFFARNLADGKNTFSVFFDSGIETKYDAAGAETGFAVSIPDRDAVTVPADAEEPEKAFKNARRLASGRETIRAFENLAAGILARDRETWTDDDRRALLSCVNIAFHTGGKIDGIYSIDGSAACEFCARMRSAAELEILIICGSCYAAADEYKEFSWRRHKLNALILSSVEFSAEDWRERLQEIPEGSRIRINEDGDTVNATHAKNIFHIFDARPDCRFGYWYKNAPAVAEGLQAEGITDRAGKLARFPHVRFIHSSILIGFRARPLFFDDCTFTVYPDQTTTDAAIAAGAWECNGRKCSACGFWCYSPENNGGSVPDIAELLRCGKAARARILDAYRTRKAQEDKRIA